MVRQLRCQRRDWDFGAAARVLYCRTRSSSSWPQWGPCRQGDFIAIISALRVCPGGQLAAADQISEGGGEVESAAIIGLGGACFKRSLNPSG